jgi:threonine dehydratase
MYSIRAKSVCTQKTVVSLQIFSGSTSQEREAVVQEVIEKTGAILVPPYDHEDIMLGQGTCAMEMEEQYREMQSNKDSSLDMILSPLGGGGLLSGICVYFSDNPKTKVFGCEPSYQGCDDGKRGLEASPPERISSVKSLTIADGLRTPVGEKPWKVFTSGSNTKPKYLEGVRSVSEDAIKQAMRLLLERVKIVVEPSSCVGLAALLFDEEFRKWIVKEQGDETWDVGLVLTGGNTTIEAIIGMFSSDSNSVPDKNTERQEGKVGMDGSHTVENVAG